MCTKTDGFCDGLVFLKLLLENHVITTIYTKHQQFTAEVKALENLAGSHDKFDIL